MRQRDREEERKIDRKTEREREEKRKESSVFFGELQRGGVSKNEYTNSLMHYSYETKKNITKHPCPIRAIHYRWPERNH